MARLGNFKGKKHSDETKEKLRKAFVGKKRPIRSKEWCENIRKAKLGKKRPKLKGKSLSAEHREKIALALRGRKEKCNLWKGGISTENEVIRNSFEYREWRNQVFSRDNYSCTDCGLKGGWNKKLRKRIVLNADHIKPFCNFKDLRFVLDNGRTLCLECHKKTLTWGLNAKYQTV